MSAKIQLSHTFEDIISLDNLLLAWQEFVSDKRNKKDVQEFQLRLMDNLIALHRDLATGNYCHGGYQAFSISDPKPRNIHKASVRDRLVHHAIYRILYPFFDRTFIADSYSCRLEKGTHKAINRFREFAYQVSRNNTRTCWILKGDIRKFFANVDHNILKGILAEYIPNQKIVKLLDEIIDSFDSKKPITHHIRGVIPAKAGIQVFNTGSRVKPGMTAKEGDMAIGLPLGNLTSQLLVNIFMNKFDQFIKHNLKAKYYIRYADDFVILADDKGWLVNQIELIDNFLLQELKLTLHPDKLFIKTLNSGMDFLGWVNFFDHRVLRTSTKRRMIKKIKLNCKLETVSSYLGMLNHGNSYELQKIIAELTDIC